MAKPRTTDDEEHPPQRAPPARVVYGVPPGGVPRLGIDFQVGPNAPQGTMPNVCPCCGLLLVNTDGVGRAAGTTINGHLPTEVAKAPVKG